MPVTIKTARQIELMRESNKKLSLVHQKLREMIRPGISTLEIDREAETLIRSIGGIPNFLHYEGYPASVCASINDEVVHGIPSDERILKDGDIISIDTGMTIDGWNSDAARTWPVGEVSDEAKRLMKVTQEAFWEGIRMARAGNHLYDISKAIGDYAISKGYGVVRDLAGHGIGRDMHEDPIIFNFAQDRKGLLLVPGMTLAIEPMITTGTDEITWADNGWTALTADHSLAAHYENTILITDGEPEILSLPEGRS